MAVGKRSSAGILAPLAAIAALMVIGAPVSRAVSVEISLDTVISAGERSITALATADTHPI
jgi:hypothetical protein